MLKRLKSPMAIITMSMIVTALTLTGRPAEARGPANCPQYVCTGHMFCSQFDAETACLWRAENTPGCFADLVMAWCTSIQYEDCIGTEYKSAYCVWE